MTQKAYTIIGDNIDVSDGYHTFSELYAHRCALFAALVKSHQQGSWKSKQHADGTVLDGWFVAGMKLPTGDITYHLPIEQFWDILTVSELEFALPWDGHSSDDVVKRILEWIK